MTITFTDNELAIIAECLHQREQVMLRTDSIDRHMLAHRVSCLRQRIEERHSAVEGFHVGNRVVTRAGFRGNIEMLNYRTRQAYIRFDIGNNAMWVNLDAFTKEDTP